MKYTIMFKPLSTRQLKTFSSNEKVRIMVKIEALADNLSGDIKRLTNFMPEYRLKVGDYRVLF
ncbi:MAG: type II toxin-antitoxin system RelE/ParE family toxin [Nitrospirae bacterium]|nr:type II toxin-antitoxin system RelE/ParE family toxin [Nitrospirota bacterium]MBF0540644.1 type II toxin-antitoxin system RelE/ParE family toxin [Nitrospirota bacterium]